MPQHKIGDIFEFGGIEYRTIAGTRNKIGTRTIENDMLHQFRPIGWDHWHTPMIAHQLITVTQKYDTEENNYPTYIPGLKGGQYLLDAIFRACTKTSWKIEAEIIERESFNAALRRK